MDCLPTRSMILPRTRTATYGWPVQTAWPDLTAVATVSGEWKKGFPTISCGPLALMQTTGYGSDSKMVARVFWMPSGEFSSDWRVRVFLNLHVALCGQSRRLLIMMFGLVHPKMGFIDCGQMEGLIALSPQRATLIVCLATASAHCVLRQTDRCGLAENQVSHAGQDVVLNACCCQVISNRQMECGWTPAEIYG